ncbi:MAG TPA: methyltransferase domain-containing protein [Acidimicrobiia bacterium]|jgi:tRNA (mo5U34)-methyltransferase|nr:methyltransferase domain-containing protein [Acidimicrobiia bacterium]
MSKRGAHAGGFGVTVEVPDWLGKMVRAVRPKPAATPDKLSFAPPPSVDIDRREKEMAFMRAFIAEEESRPRQEPADEIAAQGWYHTIELPGGVVTPGRFDHRPLLPHYGLPVDLTGKRALDVGSGDGFWAFALERTGAEVTSVDIETFSEVDMPRAIHALFVDRDMDLSFRQGMEIAHRRLGSKVKLVNSAIYDLDPASIGTFDFVHAGDILLHLRDPALALQRLRGVCSGEALLADLFDPSIDALGAGPGLTRYRGGFHDATWWAPALSTLVQMVADAGFRDVELVTTYSLSDIDSAVGPWRAVIRARV